MLIAAQQSDDWDAIDYLLHAVTQACWKSEWQIDERVRYSSRHVALRKLHGAPRTGFVVYAIIICAQNHRAILLKRTDSAPHQPVDPVWRLRERVEAEYLTLVRLYAWRISNRLPPVGWLMPVRKGESPFVDLHTGKSIAIPALIEDLAVDWSENSESQMSPVRVVNLEPNPPTEAPAPKRPVIESGSVGRPRNRTYDQAADWVKAGMGWEELKLWFRQESLKGEAFNFISDRSRDNALRQALEDRGIIIKPAKKKRGAG